MYTLNYINKNPCMMMIALFEMIRGADIVDPMLRAMCTSILVLNVDNKYRAMINAGDSWSLIHNRLMIDLPHKKTKFTMLKYIAIAAAHYKLHRKSRDEYLRPMTDMFRGITSNTSRFWF